MMLLLWSTLVKSLLLLNLSLFLFTIAYKCINFATVKIVVCCIVLSIGLCVSIKDTFPHTHKKMYSLVDAQASNILTLISYQDWKNPVWSHEVSTLSGSPVLLNMTGCWYCKM